MSDRSTLPFCDLAAQFRAHRAEIEAAIRRVLEGGQYVLGEELRRFEADFARYLGAPHAVGVSSGTAALELALLALGVGPGDEVIVPALTAVPTGMAVCNVGAIPRLADVDEETLLLDPDAADREVTPATRAIVPVHLYGQCADMERVLALAEAHGLAVVEDAAQAHGARDGGRFAGTVGRLGCFSFYPTKNLGAYGDAGAVVTSDDELAERIGALRNYGNRGSYAFEEVGPNARLDDLQAAVLRAKLPFLDGWNARRRSHAERYRDGLAGSPLRLPVERAGAHHVYHQYAVRAPRRDALRAHLAERGVETLVHYPAALHEVRALAARARFRERPRRAEEAARHLVSLPIHPELAAGHLERTVDAIRSFR